MKDVVSGNQKQFEKLLQIRFEKIQLLTCNQQILSSSLLIVNMVNSKIESSFGFFNGNVEWFEKSNIQS